MAIPEYVTIQLPGLQDIIRVPIIEGEQLKRERIDRYMHARSPVPEFLQWIPDWINYLDDAQDLLFVTLAAGRLLAPKLLARMIPVLGWALLANDALNLAVSILAAVEGTRFPKRDLLEFTKGIKRGRAGRVSAASGFLTKRFPWVPFALQGAQVLYNFTGYGLQLGTIMGAITDTVWAGFRALTGTPVKVITPPPSDPFGRAARVASQAWMIPYIAPAMNWDDIKLVVAANAAAAAWLAPDGHIPADESRIESWAQTTYQGFAPWHPDTKAALKTSGIDWDLGLQPKIIRDTAGGDMATATRRAIAHDPNLDSTFAEKAPPSPEAGATQQLHEDTNDLILDAYHDTPHSVDPMSTPWERLMSRMWHENAFPPWMVEPCSLQMKTALQEVFTTNDYYDGRPRYCRNYYSFTMVRSTRGLLETPVVSDPFRLPRWYPPIYEDSGWQLLWWLQIALALRCGKKLLQPVVFPGPRPGRVFVVGQSEMPATAGRTPLRAASLLVWGNAWSKRLTDKEIEPKPHDTIPFCIYDKRSPYPKLAGIREDNPLFKEVRDLLPKPGTLPTEIEGDMREEGVVFWDGSLAGDPTIPLSPPPPHGFSS